ncbi:hypothetical protein V8C37DRAFT_420242 [Trichoderma ceciliae]
MSLTFNPINKEDEEECSENGDYIQATEPVKKYDGSMNKEPSIEEENGGLESKIRRSYEVKSDSEQSYVALPTQEISEPEGSCEEWMLEVAIDKEERKRRLSEDPLLEEWQSKRQRIAQGWEANAANVQLDAPTAGHLSEETQSPIDQEIQNSCSKKMHGLLNFFGEIQADIYSYDQLSSGTQWPDDDFCYEAPIERQIREEESANAAYLTGTFTYV